MLLYVDDVVENLDSFVDLFEDMADIKTASTIDEARELLDNFPDIRLLISDETMPGVKGSEFMMEVAEKYPHIRRIILTAHSHIDLGSKIEAGIIHRVMFKPYDDDAMTEELSNLR